MNIQEQTFRGIRWTALSSIIRLMLQISQLAVLSRYLSPAEFGLLAIVQVIINFTQIFLDLGISNAIIYRQELKESELSSLYWLNVMSGFMLFLLVISISPLAAKFYHEQLLLPLLVQSALSFLILPFGQQFQALLQKKLEFSFLAITEIASAVAGFGVMIFFLEHQQGLFALIYATIFSSLLQTLFYVFRGMSSHRPRLHFYMSEVRGFISFGLFQMGERSVNYFSSGLDKLVIGKIFGPGLLGFYSIAHHLLYYPLRIINPVFNRVALPIYAKMQQDNPQLNETYIRNVSMITLITFPVYTGLYAVAPELVLLLMGPGWEKAADIFRIIWILGIFKSMGNPLGSYLYAKGRADIGFYLNIFQLIVYVVALYAGSFCTFEQMLLIFVAANILFLAPADYLTRYYLTRMPIFRFIRGFLPNMIAATIMFLLVCMVSQLLNDQNIIVRLVISVLTGVVSYGLYFLLIYRRIFLQKTS